MADVICTKVRPQGIEPPERQGLQPVHQDNAPELLRKDLDAEIEHAMRMADVICTKELTEKIIK